MDHDQRFKSMIRRFFADFLRLFFRRWADRFDFDTLEWIEQEVYPDPPEGARHLLDLVAKLRLKEPVEPSPPSNAAAELLVVVLFEVEERDATTRLKPRLPYYYCHLRDKYRVPVLPIALYLKVGLDGIGIDVVEERFGELTPLRFEYLYVGLPGLEAIEYVETGNELAAALSALMRVQRNRVAWLAAEAMRIISGSERSEHERYLLAECFQAYSPPLEGEPLAEYERLLLGKGYERVIQMNQTTSEKAARDTLIKLIIRMWSRRFGELSPSDRQNLDSLPINRLEELPDEIADATSREAVRFE